MVSPHLFCYFREQPSREAGNIAWQLNYLPLFFAFLGFNAIPFRAHHGRLGKFTSSGSYAPPLGLREFTA